MTIDNLPFPPSNFFLLLKFALQTCVKIYEIFRKDESPLPQKEKKNISSNLV